MDAGRKRRVGFRLVTVRPSRPVLAGGRAPLRRRHGLDDRPWGSPPLVLKDAAADRVHFPYQRPPRRQVGPDLTRGAEPGWRRFATWTAWASPKTSAAPGPRARQPGEAPRPHGGGRNDVFVFSRASVTLKPPSRTRTGWAVTMSGPGRIVTVLGAACRVDRQAPDAPTRLKAKAAQDRVQAVGRAGRLRVNGDAGDDPAKPGAVLDGRAWSAGTPSRFSRARPRRRGRGDAPVLQRQSEPRWTTQGPSSPAPANTRRVSFISRTSPRSSPRSALICRTLRGPF